jgi:hypothetical protein
MEHQTVDISEIITEGINIALERTDKTSHGYNLWKPHVISDFTISSFAYDV